MVLFVVKISAVGFRWAFDYDVLSIYNSNAIWKIAAIIEAFRSF